MLSERTDPVAGLKLPTIGADWTSSASSLRLFWAEMSRPKERRHELERLVHRDGHSFYIWANGGPDGREARRVGADDRGEGKEAYSRGDGM